MFCLWMFLAFCVAQSTSAPAPTHLLVTRVGPCDDADDTAAIVQVSEFSITSSSYDHLLSGWINVTNDLENGWKVKATMQKCVDIRNMDTCDFFKSYQLVRDGCELEEEESEMYAMVFHYSQPEIECPIKAGSFTIANYPFFTEENYFVVSESKISTSMFGYTFRLDGFTVDNRKMFCIEAYLKLVYMRVHDWTKHTDKQTSIPANNKTIVDNSNSEER